VDDLLLGGIPENYAIILVSPSNNEREKILSTFLETGAQNGQITFYITSNISRAKALSEEFRSNFYVFVCNPRADIMIENAPNVFKLNGVENLTEIGISLIKAFRNIDPSKTGPRRFCIEILSDVLLHHRAVIARKWLSELLPDLKSRGFTTLAVINPQMHPQEESQAIIGQFEGEVQIYEKETARGLQQFLRIRKLYGERYLDNDMVILSG
jgi:KaiC/GvpD/RAD55 family RecA-like ATPase